jgi:excisionase family DNA binding protein
MPTKAASPKPKTEKPPAQNRKATKPTARPLQPGEAKVRVRHVRNQIERNVNVATLTIPALITIAEMAAIANISKPTAVRILNRGEVRSYRPTGPGGIVLVHAESLAKHIKDKSSGGVR